MKKLLLLVSLPILAGNTPQFFKNIDIKLKERRRYISHLRTQSDSALLRKQPQRNIKKKLAGKQLRWL